MELFRGDFSVIRNTVDLEKERTTQEACLDRLTMQGKNG